jgi:hypothetical protein
MTPITEALHACASGILTAEAAVGLLSDCGGWLHRDDFTSQFITMADDSGILMAAILPLSPAHTSMTFSFRAASRILCADGSA